MHLREIAFLVRRTQTARPFPFFWYDLSSDARVKRKKKIDEILSEFHEHAPNVKNFQFLEKKDQIFRKIRENFGNLQIIQKIIQNYSVVSLIVYQEKKSRTTI